MEGGRGGRAGLFNLAYLYFGGEFGQVVPGAAGGGASQVARA